MRRNCKRKRKSERRSRSVHSGALLELPYGHATMRRDALSLLFEGVQEARSRHKSHEYGIPWSLGGERAARTYPKHECTEQCRHRAFFASFRARMMRRASAFCRQNDRILTPRWSRGCTRNVCTFDYFIVKYFIRRSRAMKNAENAFCDNIFFALSSAIITNVSF